MAASGECLRGYSGRARMSGMVACRDDSATAWPMMRTRTRDAQVILAVDAAACAVGAVVAAAPMADDLVGLGGRQRMVAAALAGTAAVLAAGAMRPTRARLAVASALNAGWVLAGVYALPQQEVRRGRVAVAATVAGDAVAGGLQWVLRSRI